MSLVCPVNLRPRLEVYIEGMAISVSATAGKRATGQGSGEGRQ
jgi:hypothetical protein